MVTIEITADKNGYMYCLSCMKAGQRIKREEYIKDTGQTINTKYLLALNTALGRMKKPSEILIRLENNGGYIFGAINRKWPQEWENNGWKTAKGTEVKNKELWQQYLANAKEHTITAALKTNGADND